MLAPEDEMESENGGSEAAADGSSDELVVAMAANGTINHVNETFMCRQDIPTAGQLLTCKLPQIQSQ